MKKDVKKLILEATIRLLSEPGRNPGDITVRDICREADVSVALINYHFQTKENLIAQCVQSIIGSVIRRHEPWGDALSGKTLLETLKLAFDSTLTFMYSVENISRISILTDHESPKAGDNTTQAVNAFYPLVVNLCAERRLEDPKKLVMLLVQTVQGMFLRTDRLIEELGVDLRNRDERRKFVDGYLDVVFG